MEKLRNFVQITYTLHAKEKIEAKIKRKDRNICESMKISFSITYYSKSKHEADWHFPTIQKKFPADLVTFTEEILNEKLHFLSNEISFNLTLHYRELRSEPCQRFKMECFAKIVKG